MVGYIADWLLHELLRVRHTDLLPVVELVLLLLLLINSRWQDVTLTPELHTDSVLVLLFGARINQVSKPVLLIHILKFKIN